MKLLAFGLMVFAASCGRCHAEVSNFTVRRRCLMRFEHGAGDHRQRVARRRAQDRSGVDPVDGHGELVAHAFDESSGSFQDHAAWKATRQMNDAAAPSCHHQQRGRRLAIALGTLSPAQRDLLKAAPADPKNGEAQGRALLQWLARRSSDAGRFRMRARDAALGAICTRPERRGTARGGYFGASVCGICRVREQLGATPAISGWCGRRHAALHSTPAPTGASRSSRYLPEH